MPLDDTHFPHSAPVPDDDCAPPFRPRQESAPNGIAAPAPGPDALRPPPVRPPHPGFWASLLWCIGILIVTQFIPGIIGGGILVLVILMRGGPVLGAQGADAASLQESLMKSPIFSVGMAVMVFFMEVLLIGVSWLVVRLVVGRDWPRRLALRRPGLAHLLLALAACPAMILLANGFYLFLKDVVHMKGFSDWGLGGMEEVAKMFGKWPVGFGVLVIGLGPGIGEELWCRGFLGRGLVGRYGWLGVVATSFFFGLLHVDPPQATYAMIVGLWLHFVYLTTRSLLMPMLLHFVNNSLSVVASHLDVLKQIDENAGNLPLYVFVGAAVLLAGVGYALYQSRARLAAADGGLPPWQPAYPGVEYPPPGSGTRVVHPRPSLAASLAALAGLGTFLGCCWAAYHFG